MRTLTRTEAIGDIRKEILKLVDDDHSMCEVASRLGIFCKGFRQFDDEELKKRYDWIVKKKNVTRRDELVRLANRWQLARQFVQNKGLSCDVQLVDRDTCRGWDEFDDPTLERYHRELCGEEITISG
jgi:hypothetical protein